jgi:hypothetical protein
VARLDDLRSCDVYKVIFQAQEAVYDAKVQTVKDEHEQLLQQAFERAKVRSLIDKGDTIILIV